MVYYFIGSTFSLLSIDFLGTSNAFTISILASFFFNGKLLFVVSLSILIAVSLSP